jgi:hypothetical protein
MADLEFKITEVCNFLRKAVKRSHILSGSQN